MEITSLKAGMLAAAAGLAVAAVLAMSPVSAHHSWSTEYDLSRSTSMSGTVTRVMFQSPHSALLLEVATADGGEERWTAHWGSPQRLRERGITEGTVRAGDVLLVTGNPHRDPEVKEVRVVSLRRAKDGSEIGSPRSAATR
jgi:hypothetical protein